MARSETHSHADERQSGHRLGETANVHPYDPLRFHGTVIWPTEEQGGRHTGWIQLVT